MKNKEKINRENLLLEEIANETPEKLFLTEAGTILQDYIWAYINQFVVSNKKPMLGDNVYLSNLLHVVAERINKNIETLN